MDLVLPARYSLDPDNALLGEGGMGRVYRARDVELNLPVALKVVRPELASDHRFRRLFDLEVRVSARFTHPHIVPLHDLGELEDGTPFLGLALADAGSFAQLRRCQGWSELLRLVLELLDALSHLHARDVLHRDLKPENVLLHTGGDGQRHVWLADLGLANAASALVRKKGRTEGTPGFMAPEQKLGMPREFGPWTDLYAVGVLLWEIVTGELPWGTERTALDASLPALVPRPGLSIPEGLGRVLANLLSGEPLSRYDLAADLATELRALGPAAVDAERARQQPLDLGGGTVAPSAPALSSFPGDRTGEPRGLPAGVPAWNRPYPAELPERPPQVPGRGARARASLRLFALRTPPLVAREPVVQRIWSVARAVREDGCSRVVLVVGEAGCGKSRLVESVVRRLEEAGQAEGITLRYQRPPGAEDGYAGAARALLRPWRESAESLRARLRRVLARSVGRCDDEVEELSELLTRWCGLLGDEEEAPPAGIGLREIYRRLDARAWRGLSCLVVEDVQWAVEEGDGLAIAEAALAMAEAGDARRRLVLLTLRSEALLDDPELARQVGSLVDSGAIRVDLPRLDREGTVELLQQSLTLTRDLAELVADRCEGNPLFARQLLLEWVDQGLLVDRGGLQYALDPAVDARAVLPSDAQALFRDRVRALARASGETEAFLDVLHSAALVGLRVPAELLLELAEDVGSSQLAAFVRACGLLVSEEEQLRFDHGLLFEAVREEARARVDADVLHARLARRWLRYGEQAGVEVQLQVGAHAHAAGQWSLAVLHLVGAAERAAQRGRARELDQASRLAVDATDRIEHVHHLAGWAHFWRGRALLARGDGRRAADLFVVARRLLKRRDEASGALRSGIYLAAAELNQGHVDEARSLYQRALHQARAVEDAREEARAVLGLARVEQQKRNWDGARLLFARVMARADRSADARTMAEACLGEASVARRTGALDEAEELYLEAREGFGEEDHPLDLARATLGRAVVRRQRLDLAGAEELFRDAMRTTEQLGATRLRMEAVLGLAELARLGGDLDRARELYGDEREWARRSGMFEPAILAELGMARVELAAARLPEAARHAEAAAIELEKVPGHWLWAPYRLLVAALLAAHGQEQETMRWLWSASELGLGDTVDQDIAALLDSVHEEAERRGWSRVLRLAAKLGAHQWRRLGDAERAERLAAGA